MKRKLLVIPQILACVLLSGCQGHEGKEVSTVLIPEITKKVEYGKLSDIISISNARIVGNYEDFMIGRIKKIKQCDSTNYAIQSSDSPIVIFDSANNKFIKIGDIGLGVGDYTNPLDFDIAGNTVYILTANGIMCYGLDGTYHNTIKTDINADGLHVFDDKIMLFVLGDAHVLHLIDIKGKTLAKELSRNSALRISRANPFYEYGDFVLFHEGHSNDVLAYDRKSESFCDLTILSDDNAISAKDEANLIESGDKLIGQKKMFFDALTTAGQRLCVGVMKDDKPFIYFRDKKNSTSISIPDVEDDILFAGTMSFFTKGVESNEKFLTYIYPYFLIENKDKILDSPTTPEVIKEMVGKVNEDDNPIVIEYEFK